LRVGPNMVGSVVDDIASSGELVFAKITKPASR
jgi:hypothetical protein